MDSNERVATQGALPVSRQSRTLSLGDPLYLTSAPRWNASHTAQVGFGPLFVASSVFAGSSSHSTAICALIFVIGGALTGACWAWSNRTHAPSPFLAGLALAVAAGAGIGFRSGVSGFSIPLGVGLGAAALAGGLLLLGARSRAR